MLGSDAVLTDKATRVLAGTDFITRRGVPAAVVRPTSNDQVVALLGYAAEHGLRVVPRGAATNLCAGIAPGDDSLVLDIASMNRIVEIDAQAASRGRRGLYRRARRLSLINGRGTPGRPFDEQRTSASTTL